MGGVLRLFLCFGLLARGSSLVCEICQNNSILCKGPMKNCSAKQDTCVIVLTKNTLGGTDNYILEKNCEKSEICNDTHMHFDLGSGKVYQSKLYCCNEDTCSKVVPTLPLLEKDPNGKQCPACYTWKDTCEKKTVDCTGSASDCFAMTWTIYLNGKPLKNTIKGCTSNSICNTLKRGNTPFFSSKKVETKVNCSLSGASRLVGSLLTTFSSLLILKFLIDNSPESSSHSKQAACLSLQESKHE
ncbi:phospholipase A2 inhibitor and Ly6/PLAUR domain-containing protein-like [Python bivittatus]|uniref:Phospholipase A2 inhibitor and Ly6/PLAUR domain-containing protein-like n=1 Tax=Python bivittatus TaxID=176946 RepID=A0A9F5MV96_PYTBI|nr:phospholipase A2 inhibitor and Ly6/PLAUR domain-containing protein-like [Python bivittatus]